ARQRRAFRERAHRDAKHDDHPVKAWDGLPEQDRGGQSQSQSQSQGGGEGDCEDADADADTIAKPPSETGPLDDTQPTTAASDARPKGAPFASVQCARKAWRRRMR